MFNQSVIEGLVIGGVMAFWWRASHLAQKARSLHSPAPEPLPAHTHECDVLGYSLCSARQHRWTVLLLASLSPMRIVSATPPAHTVAFASPRLQHENILPHFTYPTGEDQQLLRQAAR
jgi:hypothetical protein